MYLNFANQKRRQERDEKVPSSATIIEKTDEMTARQLDKDIKKPVENESKQQKRDDGKNWVSPFELAC